MRPAFYLRVVVVACLVTTCLLAQSSSQDPLRSRLDKAKANYSLAIESAKKRLADDFEGVVQAYTRAGKLDEALAVRQERDEFVEKSAVTVTPGDPVTKVEDGWTILFRSSNPLLWNVAVQNSDSYAVPIDRAPAGVRYLRMKRCDSNDFVIINLARDELGEIANKGAYVWQGEKFLMWKACRLGIGLPQHVVKHGDICTGKIGDRILSGFGFGHKSGVDDTQHWAWAGKEVDATVFEIAVAARDLKPDEQKKLLK